MKEIIIIIAMIAGMIICELPETQPEYTEYTEIQF